MKGRPFVYPESTVKLVLVRFEDEREEAAIASLNPRQRALACIEYARKSAQAEQPACIPPQDEA